MEPRYCYLNCSTKLYPLQLDLVLAFKYALERVWARTIIKKLYHIQKLEVSLLLL